MIIELADASQHLADLVARVQRGEEVVSTAQEQPVAKLAPVETVRQEQRAGRFEGEIWTSEGLTLVSRDLAMCPYDVSVL